MLGTCKAGTHVLPLRLTCMHAGPVAHVLCCLQVSPTAWEMITEYCAFHCAPGRSDKVRSCAC